VTHYFGTRSQRRAYLKALELYIKAEKNPQLLPNDDTAAVNLEHILPVNPDADWDISEEVAAVYHKRLGNMVLLSTKQNVEIGNGSYEKKRPVLAASPFLLTVEASQSETWGATQIDVRQARMAELAPKVWPL
jgi:hypothetical protein